MSSRRTRRSMRDLDDRLGLAAVPTGTGDDLAAEIAASRRMIEDEIADALWQRALQRDAYAQRVIGTTGVRPALVSPGPPTAPAAMQDQATSDLAELCRLVVQTSHAAADLAGLVDGGAGGEGALVFACLLHLADRPEGAQFWWKFSAGTGKSTAALCLYFAHLQRGELRDAEHWAHEAVGLEVLEHHAVPPAGPRGRHVPQRAFYLWEDPDLYDRGYTTVESMLLRIVTSSWATSAGTAGADPADELTEAVDHLAVDHDPYFGDIPRPDTTLAARVREYLAS
ncbi:hypothetical protein [Streptomyces hainanensis]|uniref:Uncharacterized protein n=1 Tax=Streptomyces hainanensis TaxID=402648 RepID=A0A4R4TR45_9ACTN|nr:hypothetical protein [Streptomyces hainanensis]TDC77653.1 hypothetical protein E1283_06790 [Streptomyces hainanensis]